MEGGKAEVYYGQDTVSKQRTTKEPELDAMILHTGYKQSTCDHCLAQIRCIACSFFLHIDLYTSHGRVSFPQLQTR